MKPVKVRNLVIGAGLPKICVPIVGETRTEIVREARSFRDMPVDLVEWRVDWYEDVFDISKVEETLNELREVLEEIPLLFTFRTAKEGGEKAIAKREYAELNIRASRTGCIDLVDTELFTGDEAVREIVRAVHAYGVKVVASNHDFEKTPSQKEMVARLRKMQKLGADILKIAVMPRNKKDVLTLLSATEEMASNYADCPIITISMGKNGEISRICGGLFGSAVTFGAASKVSAPGQMAVQDLKSVLKLLY